MAQPSFQSLSPQQYMPQSQTQSQRPDLSSTMMSAPQQGGETQSVSVIVQNPQQQGQVQGQQQLQQQVYGYASPVSMPVSQQMCLPTETGQQKCFMKPPANWIEVPCATQQPAPCATTQVCVTQPNPCVDPCAKVDPCHTGSGWNWVAALIIWFIVFVIVFWIIYYSLRPAFVQQNGTATVDTGKVLLAAVLSALALILVIWLIRAAVMSGC